MEGQREALVRSPLGRRVVTAMMRMGRTLDERGAWFCNFMNCSLDGMSPGDLERLRCELLAWAIGRPEGLRFGRTVRYEGPTGYVSDEYGLPPLDTEDDPSEAVRAHQNYLHGVLWDLFSDGRAAFDIDVKHTLARQQDGSVNRAGVGTPANSVRSAVSDLIVALGPRLRRCRALGCGNFFVAQRRQEYCSGRCSQRTRTATHFKKYPDKQAKKKRAARAKKAEVANEVAAQAGAPPLPPKRANSTPADDATSAS
jgi:hypothetical protein